MLEFHYPNPTQIHQLMSTYDRYHNTHTQLGSISDRIRKNVQKCKENPLYKGF